MAYFKKYKTKNKGELWLFKIDVGVDPETGARKTTTRRGFGTKKEAQDAARVMETQREDGTLAIERQGVTIREFLLEWLEVYKRGKVRENTYKIHVYAVNKHLLPLLGYYKVKDLSPGFYQKTINELAKGGLSRRTVEIIHSTMSHAMNKAVELEIIRKNPCSKAKVPDAKKTVRASRKVIGNYLSRDEVNRFLAEAKAENQAYYLGFKAMIFLGLRKGESFALWPEDLDVEANTVRIERTLHYNKMELEEMFGPPKTESSYRFILADPELMGELKEQARLRKKKAFALQSEYRSETNLLIDRGDGNPLAKSTIQRAFKRILKKAGIDRDVTVHGLRHTHAVMMLESGATLKEVQERLGHKSIEITSDVYSHITEKIEQRSVNNFVMYMAGD